MPGSIRIEKSNYSIQENDAGGVLSVRIIRTDSAAGEVSVGYSTVANSATAGEDYVTASGTVIFAEGEISKVIEIPIIDDALPEGTERLNFVIDSVTNATLTAPRTADIAILDDEAPTPEEGGPDPFRYPVTTELVTVADGLENPMTMQWLPGDSDIMLVAEKPGRIAVVQDGEVVSTALDISERVNSSGDRGLMDMELDPDFANSPYVYVTYVYDPDETQDYAAGDPAGPDGIANRPARVSRFLVTFDEDGLPQVDPDSEEVLIGSAGTWENISGPDVDSTVDLDQPPSGIDPVTGENLKDYIAVDSSTHAPGDIEFGPDGHLYVTTGDGTSYNAVDPRSLRVQDVNNLSGKVLRVHKDTGLGMADNPFYTGDDTDNASKVYQLGLRNGFRMDFDPVTGQIWIGDVGWTLWEQVETGSAGANYGWPFYEGGSGVTTEQPIYSQLEAAQAFYDLVASGEATVNAPYIAFSHNPEVDGPDMQAIVMGGVFYGDAYPEALQGDLFFADVSGRIYTMDVNDPDRIVRFLTAGDFMVDYVQGPDGKFYAASLFDGTIKRIDITPGLPPNLSFAISNFSTAANLNFNGSAAASGAVARLTPAVNDFEAGSVFHEQILTLGASTSFSTRFAFRLAGGDGPGGSDGFAFVLQNSAAGADALGYAAGGLGYSGIGTSLAIAFDTYENEGDGGSNQIEILVDGDTFLKIENVTAPFDLNGGSGLRYAWVLYSGQTNELSVFLSTNSTRPAAPVLTTVIDIPAVMGGAGYVGFTGATGGLSNRHDIVSWQFDAIEGALPSSDFSIDDMPGAAGMFELNGSATFSGDALVLTQAVGNFERGSAFLTAPVSIDADTSFSTEFGFRIAGGSGSQGSDGFTFVMHSNVAGDSALGYAAGGLGYSGIGSSLAIAFDTYQNEGDAGGNQVQILFDGDTIAKVADVAAPFDLNGSAAERHVWIQYNGTTNRLSVYLSTGTTRPAAPVVTAVVDLDAVLGAAAHVGFTGATGGSVNRHEITEWAFSTSDAAPVEPTLFLAAAAAEQAEGDGGSTSFTFTVTRTGDLSEASSVDFAVTGSGERPATAADFLLGTLPAGTVTFAAGEDVKTITIQVAGDAAAEPDETFALTLTDAVGADIAVGVAEGVIQNDDGTVPGYSFAYGSFADVAGLRLNGVAAQEEAVLRLTQAENPFERGSAFHRTPIDFDADTSFTTEFGFRIAGGDGSAGSDGFTFVLQSSGARAGALGNAGGGLGYSGIGASLAIAFDTYQNAGDDGGNQVQILLNGDTIAKVAEAAASFDLNGAATPRRAWVEYDGVSNRLSVYLGEGTTRPATPVVTAAIDLDAALGADVYAGFTAATGGSDNQHDILDWSFTSEELLASMPSLAIASAAANRDEGDAGTTPFTFTVTRTGDLSAASSVAYAVTGAGANPASASDFVGGVLPGGTLTFAAGQASQTISVAVAGDAVTEFDESFQVRLSNPVGATVRTVAATGTILDDDAAAPAGLVFDYPDFSVAPDLRLNGVASAVGGAIRLTQATAAFERGSAFHDEAAVITDDTSFETSFSFRIAGGDGAAGADGFAFVLQGRGAGALGYAGGGLGYSGIGASLAVAFDTYQNDGDIGGNHVQILTDGETIEKVEQAAAPFDLNGDGDLRFAWIDYDGATNELSLYVSEEDVRPGAALLTAEIDLFETLGGPAYAGFTAGTGGLDNQHSITQWAFASGEIL